MIPRGDKVAALYDLFEETVALFHRMRAAAEQIHGQGEWTAGRRGVMLGLKRGGPQTVPQMARARPVSRQYIQNLVHRLLDDRLVELADNPAHKRSKLVRLTARGERLLAAMLRRENGLLRRLRVDAPEDDIRRAAATLGAVRRALARQTWRRNPE